MSRRVKSYLWYFYLAFFILLLFRNLYLDFTEFGAFDQIISAMNALTVYALILYLFDRRAPEGSLRSVLFVSSLIFIGFSILRGGIALLFVVFFPRTIEQITGWSQGTSGIVILAYSVLWIVLLTPAIYALERLFIQRRTLAQSG